MDHLHHHFSPEKNSALNYTSTLKIHRKIGIVKFIILTGPKQELLTGAVPGYKVRGSAKCRQGVCGNFEASNGSRAKP